MTQPLQNSLSSLYQEFVSEDLYSTAIQHGIKYLNDVTERNVFPSEEAIDALSFFEQPIPTQGESALSIINSLNKYGAPATIAQTGGRYFGFVSGGIIPAGLAAKLLGTFWDQNSAMHVISPICSKLEVVVERWLKEIFGFPESVVAGFVSGTSIANYCALAAARFRILQRQGWDINEKGMFNAPPIRIVAGRQVHATIIKAISLLGFGKQNIEWVDTDSEGRLIAEKLPPLDSNTIVILQAGNVNSGSFDPFEAVCKKAKEAKAWVHIDGAFGLWAAATEKLKGLTAGIEKADSWAVDGHKTLNTPYDNGIVLCADKDALRSALHASGSYLVLNDVERDGMFYTMEMSRRSRIIELWATMKSLGRNGIAEMVDNMHARAVQFAKAFNHSAGFHVMNSVVFNQVLVSCNTDDLTTAVMKRVQQLRECWVGGSAWHGKKVIRISVSSWLTTEDDVDRSVASFKKALDDVLLTAQHEPEHAEKLI